MTECTCSYNTQRKGLTEESCEECYAAFIEREALLFDLQSGVEA